MTRKYFSIIVPTLNEEMYISNLLSSLNSQIYKDFEVVIVDNGSKDKTIKTIRNFKARFPIKIVQCHKKGISYARNYGVKFSKSKFLLFFDADGIINKNWLRNAKKIVTTNPNLVAISGIYFYHPAKNIFKSIIYNFHHIFLLIYLILKYHIFGKVNIIGNNLLINREVFIKLGMFPHFINEDIFFTKIFNREYKGKKFSKLSLKLIAYQSPRRFEKFGYIRTLVFWIKYTVKKTSSKHYNATR